MNVHEITSEVAAGVWLTGAQFIDAYRIGIDNGALDAREAARRMFARSPRWIEAPL